MCFKVTSVFVSDIGTPVVSYDRPEQPLDLITEACMNLEVALGTDIYLVLNCAAQNLVDYVSTQEMFSVLVIMKN